MKRVVTLTSGGAFLSESEDLYSLCKNNEAPYNGMGCIDFNKNRKKLQVKPRAITGSNAMPLGLIIKLPAFAQEVIMEPFDTPASEPVKSFAALKKEGVNTQVTFFNNDIVVTPGGNWFDLGISF